MAAEQGQKEQLSGLNDGNVDDSLIDDGEFDNGGEQSTGMNAIRSTHRSTGCWNTSISKRPG